MKVPKVNSLKKAINISIIIILFMSACSPSKKNDKTNNSIKVETAVDKPNVNIHTAVLSGNLEAVKQHIKAGTNINEKEAMSGSTPLITAASFDKPKIAKALIDANADLSLKNNDGATALHTASFFGRIEIVQMLIDAKADKTIRNNFGATPRETVMGDFAELKPIYEMLKQQLEPMGFELNLEELEKARPVVAIMLQ